MNISPTRGANNLLAVERARRILFPLAERSRPIKSSREFAPSLGQWESHDRDVPSAGGRDERSDCLATGLNLFEHSALHTVKYCSNRKATDSRHAGQEKLGEIGNGV
jgi:hypothetical protein